MKTITVKGMGKVSVKPDLIVISMNLETKDKDYEQTMNLASEKINMLSKALQNVGFKKDDIKTCHFNIRTNYESERDGKGIYKSVSLRKIKKDLKCRLVTGRVRTWNKTSS